MKDDVPFVRYFVRLMMVCLLGFIALLVITRPKKNGLSIPVQATNIVAKPKTPSGVGIKEIPSTTYTQKVWKVVDRGGSTSIMSSSTNNPTPPSNPYLKAK